MMELVLTLCKDRVAPRVSTHARVSHLSEVAFIS